MLRGIPRMVWILSAGRFVSSASSMLMLFLTLYLTGPRGLGVTAAGVVAGSYGVGMLVGNLTGGRWGDIVGHRRVLVSGSTIVGLGVASIPWLPLPALVVALPVLAYLGATVGVSNGALSALAVPRGDRRTAVAIGRAASNAGFVLGPPLGALVVVHSYSALFVIDGVVTLLTRLAIGAVLGGEHAAPLPAATTGPGFLRSLRVDRSLLLLLPAIVAADVVYRQLYTTVPLRLRDAGEPVALYTAIIAIGSGLILLLEIPLVVRLRRHRAFPIIGAGYALIGAGFALFGLPVSVGTAVLAMVVLTAGELLYKSTATAHVLDSAPDHLVGQYQGLYTGAATSGTMLSAPVGAAVYASAPSVLWPLCAAVAGGAALLAVVAGRVSASAATSLSPVSAESGVG